MNKLIKTGNTVIISTEDGRTFLKKDVSSEDFIAISDNLDNDEWLIRFFNPQYHEEKKKLDNYNLLISDINSIPFLFYNNEEKSVYWQDVSPLSMPEDFTYAVIDAYKKGDEKSLNAYKNFWILLSLNPDDECRKNLWWFLNLHGLKISSSGFFVAYRNVMKTNKQDEDGNPIYTDAHTYTTKISIGKTVSIPREDCDCDSGIECSRGLHAASVTWLKENYFGDTGMVVLVNPYKVVAVPHRSEYGKLRCCEYIPIDYSEYDEHGNIIPYDVEQGFECKYAAQAIYEGIVNIEKDRYTIKVPSVKGLESNQISNNLLEIAKQCITNKSYNVID